MSEEILAEGSPLAQYLEDPDRQATDDDALQDRRPSRGPRQPSKRVYSGNGGLRPLQMADSRKSRRVKFYRLFSLPQGVNSRFVERFRYIICTSQLLNPHIQPSQYSGVETGPSDASDEEQELQRYYLKHGGSKFWVGSGGCVLVVAILMSWIVKSNNTRFKYLASFVLCLMISLYLYAIARQKILRRCRAQAITILYEALAQYQRFDVAANRCLGLVQEVEVLRRGYQQSSPMPPISRLDKSVGSRECLYIRRTLAACLNLAHSAFERCINTVQPLVMPQDLAKIQDVYDFGDDHDEDSEEQVDDSESLGGLRALLLRMHQKRRHFLCCLLAIEVRPNDWSSVRTIHSSINETLDLVGRLESELERTLEGQLELTLPRPSTPKSQRSSRPSLNILNMSQTLRRTQARLYLLRGQAAKHGDTDRSDLATQYESLGVDLKALLEEWENGRHIFAPKRDNVQFSTPSFGASPSFASTFSTMPTLSKGASDDDDESVRSRPSSFGDWGPQWNAAVVEMAGKENVFETIGMLGSKPDRNSPVLSRQERIVNMQRERERALVRAAERESKGKMVSELKSVLHHRRPSDALDTRDLNDGSID